MYVCLVRSNINLRIIVEFGIFAILTNIGMECKLIAGRYNCLVYPEGILSKRRKLLTIIGYSST
jgi:hypothetical protein